MDIETTKRVLAALHREHVRYVLVGAVAINLHGLARATQDIDLFVDVDAANIERLKKALRSVFDDPDIDQITAADLAGSYPTIRYVPPAGDLLIDVLGRLGDRVVFRELQAEEKIIDGIPVRVATPQTLYRMKRDSLRLQDRADAEALRRRFQLED